MEKYNLLYIDKEIPQGLRIIRSNDYLESFKNYSNEQHENLGDFYSNTKTQRLGFELSKSFKKLDDNNHTKPTFIKIIQNDEKFSLNNIDEVYLIEIPNGLNIHIPSFHNNLHITTTRRLYRVTTIQFVKELFSSYPKGSLQIKIEEEARGFREAENKNLKRKIELAQSHTGKLLENYFLGRPLTESNIRNN